MSMSYEQFLGPVAGAKRRFKINHHSNAREGAGTKQAPDEIVLTRKNGQWSARAGSEIVLDDTPEQALHRLMLRLQVATGDLAEQRKIRQLCDCQRAPSCDLADFQIQPALDGFVAYKVHFTSNVKLHRGDFEKLFCQCVRREDLHDSATCQQ